MYLAHAAVSDMAGQQHLYAEAVARAALGMAGVIQSAQHTKIYLKNWSTQIEADRHRLKVKAADFSYEFSFKPAKPLVMHGDRGYDRKGSTPDRASCYYSFTRLEGQGSITIGDYVMISPGTRISAAESITIGDAVMMANGVYIPRFRNLSDQHPDFLRGYGLQGAALRTGWWRGVDIVMRKCW